ncbi:protoporphyrinogen oxidase [Paenibacillus sp.]|jgi:oxygen-dependent protoporphyrinogen oxidase|uniref:protoporphyrinogen oxidase n=1 Tax=Paenibacillus sp. TaxID=58172 RepID=UPI0028314FEE|nr:protoporphyrinogen oxidase [Paenibacillus sp.]MDR0267446.1 protoporphyrinogen oxidase [Paenibacillus sp.]
MKKVVVIGGGITGLSTAYYLQKAANEKGSQIGITIVEASDQLGGKIRTAHDGEFTMETGADSIVTRKTNAADLIEELGLKDQVVYNATGISYIYSDGKLKQIPKEAVFGIPTSIESLATTELVSAEGKVEALKDLYTPNERFTKDDSVGDFLEAFFGKEFVEKQIAPVLSGVYSGKLSDLTIASTLPYLIDYKNEYGSIIKGLSENIAKFQSDGGKKFLSFREGVSQLIGGLENHLSRTEIIKGVAAETLKPTENGGYEVTLMDGRILEADVVVISTLSDSAKKLLRSPRLNKEFDQFKNSSLISVYIAFDVPDKELPADGTGFITADSEDVKCNACTWTSRKWEHTSTEGQLLVRLFYKSSNPYYGELVKLSEEELLKVGMEDIQASLGITSRPLTYDVTKWHEGMPNYHITHHQIVKSLEAKMDEMFPNVFLAGCSYYGVGIPDCIANGEETAAKILNLLAE